MSLREQLQDVYEQHGELTPEIVLEDARDKKHPLHARFEWDDSIAAERYRLDQAHQLIVSCKVVYRDPKGRERDLRAFHALPSEGSKGFTYKPVEEIAKDAFLTEILAREMERDWKQLRQRWGHFQEFVELVKRDIVAA